MTNRWRRLSRAVATTVGLGAWCAATTAPAASAQPGATAEPRVEASAGGAKADARRSGLIRTVEPPPAPTPEQLRAFRQLRDEARRYEHDARDYRHTLNTIVRHHYEERRRRILAALNREIDIEKEGLVDARDEAIRRFEEFIARYNGDAADPSATPDAMFRLAALYEERARSNFEADLAPGLEPAIALYLRILDEFPGYEERAAVHYYLGHAYTDSARLEEGQQAWRALVCANRYQVKRTPGEGLAIDQQPLVQDHDQQYWFRWYQENPLPLDQVTSERPPSGYLGPGEDEELAFRDPYRDCVAITQEVEPGQEPRYVAEIWWQLGNFHFDQLDPRGGPYNLNRAVSAYQHSLEYNKPPLFGVALYKLAWTFFKQQRYHTATDWFVKLLYYADEQEQKTGDPGADFRAEAYTYIAGSLTYVDFDGPRGADPYIPRNDVLDLEPDPLVAEREMAVAIERVQDSSIVPQDEPWTVEIYKSLAQEFIEITQNRNAITALELTLGKFPLDRDAPVMQNRVAELYDELARLSPDGSSAHDEYSRKALDARTALAAYVGATAWTDANRDDPEALQQAEVLVRTGLKQAASDHTNYARGYYERALELSDEAEQRSLLERAITEYRLADQGWYAYLEQDPTSLDAYESRFWLADARYWNVVLQIALGRSPGNAELTDAREALVAVRDSNEDDKYLQPSAFYLVSIAEKVLEGQYRVYEDSGGTRGLEERKAVRFEGGGAARQVVRSPVPAEVVAAIKARDEYNERIAPEKDPQQNGLLYAYQAADYYFVYGHFDAARERFQPLYDEHCGKDEWGYRAWEKLISMSNFEGNVEASRALAEGKSCAFNEETRVAEEQIREPVKQGVAYLDARKLYEEAEKMDAGPERDKKWRAAAAAYKVALDAAPDRDEAPEAAMNGAYAYKQVGEYDKAIAMYELFIARYGDEKTLTKLRVGAPDAEPPAAAEPEKYGERVGYLGDAYDALAAAYVLFFNYPRAAETFDTISQNQHFSAEKRRGAARQALSLYASLGDRGGMSRALKRFAAQGASSQEMAEADYIVATADLKQWDRLSPNSGANADARVRAQSAMARYYTQYSNREAGAKYAVRAAYYVSLTKAAIRSGEADQWRRDTIRAFERWKNLAPKENGKSTALGSIEANMAAEAHYVGIDLKLKATFDYDTGHHRYKGTPVEVVKAYQKDATAAQKWYGELGAIVEAYLSPEWTTVAVARQGSLYDSLRTGLYNTRPPDLRMFDAKTEAVLRRAEESDNLDLQEKADAVRLKVRQAWRDKRDQELQSADRITVDRYATSVVLARRYNISNPAVTQAVRRLAFFTDLIGEGQMQQYTANVQDLNYTAGMFPRMRPGLVTTPKPSAMAIAPVAGGAP